MKHIETDTRNLAKWLNEEQTAPIDRPALARVLAHLQQAEQAQPVAGMTFEDAWASLLWADWRMRPPKELFSELHRLTAPLPRQPWVGLTRDERMDIINRFNGQDWIYAVDSIEAKLKEKNK